MLTRGVFDESMDRAYTQITGFVKESDGRYLRFSQTAYNLALETKEMLAIAKGVGFAKIYCAGPEDLTMPVENPGSVPRVFFVCQKS